MLRPIYSIINVKPEWKAGEYIRNTVAKRKGNVDITVSFYPGIDGTRIRQFISQFGARTNSSASEHYGLYKISIPANQVRSLASWYGVQSISPATDMAPCDLQSRPAVKGNIANASALPGGYGLTGDSVTVGVGDNSSGIYHADIKDRIVNFNPAVLSTHGEHVNGIVGGTGNLDPLAEGIAPHVSLIDHLYDQVLYATGAMFHNYNMTITNNSYGVLLGDCSYSGSYDGYAHFLDTLVMQYPEVLHVFASANDGWMSCSPYPQGFSTVGGGFTSAKNNLVVGSMTDYLYRADDESRGPTRDGRLKPETIAIGLGAYSTIGIDNYEWTAGTSMASPQVASGVAVLTQHYKHLNGGISPRSDLLKAILLNGTMDLGNPGPDYTYGFGAMDLSRSLKIIDNARFYTNTINNGANQTASITVPANTAQLKVMLCWNDPPASTSSAIQLVNDLDLSVTTPASVVHLPLVPDETPANVTNDATEKADHLNNTEQVTINNPVAGTYTIKVNGFHIPIPAQRYSVVYDFVPSGTQLTFPVGGEQLSNIDSIRIFWNTITDGHTFKVQFSPDNGANWITIDDTASPSARYCSFVPLGYNSGNCLMKITKNGTTETATSGRFAINTQTVLTLDTMQCPGYVNINWHPVPNATSYQVLAKKGAYMQIVGTTVDTTYSLGDMSRTEKSYVSVRPVINGLAGYRSKAISRIASTGNCSGTQSNGDIAIVKATSPVSGRMYTSGQLGTNETLSVQIRNLYTTACSSYSVSYRINGGTWVVAAPGTPIPANSTITYSINGINLSALGNYDFTVAVNNQGITDPHQANDTIKFSVANIPNDTLTLPLLEDFEGLSVISVLKDTFGLSPNGHWDFQTHDTAGRMRSFVNDNITIGGNRSVSLDEDRAVSSGSNNLFTGTFNLAAYDTGTAEIRMDFDYVLHGTPKTAAGNTVTYRAGETSSWLPLLFYDLNAYAGTLNKAKSISLTDAVRAENTNFTRNMQIAFGQNDTSLIAAANYGNGMTIDNVKLYTVANDAELVKVVSPIPSNCGLSLSQPLTVQVHNGVNYTLYNVALNYKMDGGATFSGTIDSITAKNTVNYTFTQPINIPVGTTHQLDIWLSAPGDTYNPNDSILNYKFRNNKIITAYPYLENFEAGDGSYYTDGINNSWQYGTPVSHSINKAASGVKAWKTNLTGVYNNLETSYLYSPCFDISTLSNPMLSLSMALDIENCGGTMCDKAYIEYTTDGSSWTKLGSSGQGTNWYDSTFNVWNTNGFTRWHVASIPLPAVPAGHTISFRFVLASDPGAAFEGIAVDDIHIYDKINGIFPASGATAVANSLSPGIWQNYIQNNLLMAAINPLAQPIGNTKVTLYDQQLVSNPTQTQFTLPRSYTISSDQPPADSIAVRLYLLERDVLKVLSDTTCPSCGNFADAYSLGITQFTNKNKPAIENDKLIDDTGGSFTFTPYNSVQWVPYDNGYYVSFKTRSTGEFWFNDGGPAHSFPAGEDYLNFAAWKDDNYVQLFWHSLIDTAVVTYTLERSNDNVNFSSILDTAASQLNPANYAKRDFTGILSSSVLYYRLKWKMKGGSAFYYSPVRKIDYGDTTQQSVNFTANMTSAVSAVASWTSFIDGVVNHYVLEREVNNRGYTTLATTPALHHHGQQYNFTDIPGIDIPAGAQVSYRLTATLYDGTKQVFNSSIDWAEANSVANIYPNPTTDGNMTMIWYAQPGTAMDIDLTDVAGRSLYHSTQHSMQWKNTTTLQTGIRAKGVYIIKAVIGDRKFAAKVLYEY